MPSQRTLGRLRGSASSSAHTSQAPSRSHSSSFFEGARKFLSGNASGAAIASRAASPRTTGTGTGASPRATPPDQPGSFVLGVQKGAQGGGAAPRDSGGESSSAGGAVRTGSTTSSRNTNVTFQLPTPLQRSVRDSFRTSTAPSGADGGSSAGAGGSSAALHSPSALARSPSQRDSSTRVRFSLAPPSSSSSSGSEAAPGGAGGGPAALPARHSHDVATPTHARTPSSGGRLPRNAGRPWAEEGGSAHAGSAHAGVRGSGNTAAWILQRSASWRVVTNAGQPQQQRAKGQEAAGTPGLGQGAPSPLTPGAKHGRAWESEVSGRMGVCMGAGDACTGVRGEWGCVPAAASGAVGTPECLLLCPSY